MPSNTPETQDRLIYVRWSDDGQHIRKWAREPFAGATAFANAGNGAPLGPFDADDHCPVAQLPFALRSIAENIHVQCADHVLEDMVRIVTDAASVIEGRHRQSSSNAGGAEPWPGCFADLQRRRVTTLAKLGLMLSEMGKGDAAKDELYAEVLMALAIEDAEDADIALEIARDEPDGDILASLSTLTTPPTPDRIGKDAVREALEDAFCAGWDARHDGQNYYESRDNYVTRALSATPAQEGEQP